MSKQEHGTPQTYVTGFVLSLAFTIIPYVLVTATSFTGDALLAAILGFAVLQMMVQIVFFLHLGRGPKPLYNIVFFISTAGIILFVVGGSIFIMRHLRYNMTPAQAAKQLAEKEAIYQVEGTKTGACQTIGANHQIIISGGKVSPARTRARLCDTLTFINQDSTVRSITFGPHPQHGTYAGESEMPVRKGRNKTITLNEAGSYQFHDHLDPSVAGDFTVTTR